jgi:hypothetical protein
MTYGICNISSIPIRKEPAESSEMRTELLFGEYFEVLDEIDRWSHIRTSFDNYDGWIDKKLIVPLKPKDFQSLSDQQPYIAGKYLNIVKSYSSKIDYYIGGGSSLHFFDSVKKTFKIGREKFRLKTEKFIPDSDIRESILKFSLQYLNAAYLWGGRNPFGIDCSGLSQIAYKVHGIPILRDASQQVSHGVAVNFVNEAQTGDLAFFDNAEGIITHVGIVIAGGKIIHASGKVRIDNLDHQGIFNNDTKRYTHKLRVIKDIIS